MLTNKIVFYISTETIFSHVMIKGGTLEPSQVGVSSETLVTFECITSITSIN